MAQMEHWSRDAGNKMNACHCLTIFRAKTTEKEQDQYIERMKVKIFKRDERATYC